MGKMLQWRVYKWEKCYSGQGQNGKDISGQGLNGKDVRVDRV